MGESEKYAVVEFPNDQVNGRPLVQEVPMHWVTDDKTECWWPPKNVSKEIKNYASPTETWKLYPVVLLKICDNLSDARLKCIQSSDAEQNEEMGKHMRKKKETYRHMFRDSSYSPPPAPNSVFNDEISHCTDTSNDPGNKNSYVTRNGIGNECTPGNGIGNKYVPFNELNTNGLGNQNEYVPSSGCKNKYGPGMDDLNTNQGNSKEYVSSDTSNDSNDPRNKNSYVTRNGIGNECTPGNGLGNKYVPSNELNTNGLGNQNEYVPGSVCRNKYVLGMDELNTNQGNSKEYVSSGVYNRGDGNPTFNEYCGNLGASESGSACSYTTLTNYVPTPIRRTIASADIEELKTSISTLTVEIKRIAKVVMESNLKISNIEEILMDRNKTTSESTREFKRLFPMKSKEELIKFSDEMLADPTQIESLKSFLLGIGGLGPKDHHARMMKTLLTNELGIVCSWKGLRGNMKLQNLKLFDVCGDVLKSHWNITEKEFELFTQDWLRHCAQRKKREDSKLGHL